MRCLQLALHIFKEMPATGIVHLGFRYSILHKISSLSFVMRSNIEHSNTNYGLIKSFDILIRQMSLKPSKFCHYTYDCDSLQQLVLTHCFYSQCVSTLSNELNFKNSILFIDFKQSNEFDLRSIKST